MSVTTRTTPQADAQGRDALLALSRRLMFIGLATTPMLVLRFRGLTAADILLIAALIVGLLARGRTVTRVHARLQLAAFLSVLGLLLAAFRTAQVGNQVGVAARVAFLLVGLVTLAGWHLRTAEDVEAAAKAFGAGTAIFGAAAILTVARPGIFGLAYDGGRVVGLAQHVTDAGGICAVGAVLLLGVVLLPGNRRWVLALLLTLTGLFLAGSVSGMLAIAAAAAFLVATRTIRLRVVVAGAGMLWLAQTSLERLAQYGVVNPLARVSATTGGRYDTLGSRLLTDQFAWNELRSDLASFVIGSPDKVVTDIVGLQVHNMLLQAWLKGGLLFLTGMLIAFVSALLLSLRPEEPQRLRRLLGAALVAGFAFAQTSPLLYNRYVWLPLVLLYALETQQVSRRSATG